MKNIQKLSDGTLIVPASVHRDNKIIELIRQVKPNNPDYPKLHQAYEREQAIEAEIQAKLAKDKSTD